MTIAELEQPVEQETHSKEFNLAVRPPTTKKSFKGVENNKINLFQLSK